MLNTPLHLVSILRLEELLNNEEMSCVVRAAGYSNFVSPSYNEAKCPNWLVLLKNHPAKLISYLGTTIRFQFVIHLNPTATPSAVRKLKLRKLYPNHHVRTSACSPLGGLLVEARIPHTEPVITLIDSLHAAERIWEEFKKDE